ncbi:unnamed protein product [marine sediment metagenome]|uniref:Uncharacterized protein n=1 Tax=marine sediment metagenome TaxID=412755 RepID=X1V6P7_9ZZZZ
MKFILNFTHTAKKVLKNLKENSGNKKQYKAVIKTFKFSTQNLKHPGLQTHIYYSLQGPNGEKVFESYAEQSTSAVYGVFFYYGPRKGELPIYRG